MDELSVAERVKAIIIEMLGVDEGITPEARFTEDLDADSLDAVELIITVEEEFGITIPDDDAELIKTVGELIKYVEEHPRVRE